MTTMKNIKKSKGFTLVELLIVIAIIGVLASLIYPALSQAMGAGSKVKSMNSASNIAKTWLSYVKTGTKTRIVTGQTIYDWAAALARGVDDFNDPKLWILDFDLPVIEKISSGAAMPKFVIDRKGSSTRLDPEFKSFPISWAVANRTDPNAPSGTPLVWTRGLKPNGECARRMVHFPPRRKHGPGALDGLRRNVENVQHCAGNPRRIGQHSQKLGRFRRIASGRL